MKLFTSHLPRQLALSLLICASITGILSTRAGASFDQNSIMDDSVFDASTSMTESQIQSFLNGFPSSCISNYSSYEPLSYFNFSGSVPASRIIKETADMWGISPKVLLATLEKESSLVSGGAGCASWRFNSAMGYNCPDSGGIYDYPNIGVYGTCVAKESDAGFSRQVNHAGWLLKFGKERATGNIYWDGDQDVTYYGYFTPGVRQRSITAQAISYDGYYTIDGASVLMKNGPTASLYTYTPHFHGNQVFVQIYEQWFGSTKSSLSYVQQEGSSAQYIIYNGKKQALTYDGLLAWNINKLPLYTMSQTVLDTYPSIATPLTRYAVVDGTSSQVFADNGIFYDINDATADAWGHFNGISQSTTGWAVLGNAGFGGNLPFMVTRPNDAASYIMESGTLRPTSTQNVITTWGGGQPIALSSTYANTLTIGSPITHNIVSNSGTLYLLNKSGAYAIPPSVAALLSGYTPYPISNGSLARYAKSGNLSHLVKSVSESAIYAIDNSSRRPITTFGTFMSLRNDGRYESALSQEAINLLPLGRPLTSSFLSDGSSYYLVNGQKTVISGMLSQELGLQSIANQVSTSFLSLFSQSSTAFSPFIKSPSSAGVYLVSNGGKIPIDRYDVLVMLGGQNSLTVVGDDTLSLIPTNPTPATPVMSDGTTTRVFDGQSYYEVTDSSILKEWGITKPATTISSQIYQWLSSRTTSYSPLSTHIQQPDGYYCIVSSGRHCAEQYAMIFNWDILTNVIRPSNEWIGYTGSVRREPLSLFVSGVQDSAYAANVFLMVDGKLWYIATPNTLSNLGFKGSMTRLSSGYMTAALSGQSTNGYLFNDSGSRNWVIDGGIKRQITSGAETNWGTSPLAQAASSYFTDLFPSGSSIGKTITRSGPGIIYGMDSGNKRGISTYGTYTTSWAPYALVSDSLLPLIPDGQTL